MRISPFTSWFLDLLRVVAAVGVVLSHLASTKFASDAGWLQPFGHLMVVCFFVLSGFLIAASVDGKNTGGVRYAALRLGRLWSVAIPCLLITVLLQFLGQRLAVDQLGSVERSHSVARYGLTALFMNELWFKSAGPGYNLPVWSLAYEAWYYALYGVVRFVRDRVWRVILVVGLAAIAGPKILILFPIWLLGVFLWSTIKRFRQIPIGFGWAALGVSVCAIAVWTWFHPLWPSRIGYAPWFFSSAWLSDFVFGIAIAGLIFAVNLLWGSFHVSSLHQRWVRSAAGVTFTVYLLHYPLMIFVSKVVAYDRASLWHVGGLLVLLFAIMYLFGSWIEPERKQWTAQIESLFRAVRKPRRRRIVGVPTAPA